MLCERTLADPARDGGHHGLGHVGVVDPPQRQAGQAAREELRSGLDLLGRDARARLLGDEPGEHLTGAQADLPAPLADLVVTGAVAEEHHPGVAVLANVVEPMVEDGGHPHAFEKGREVVLVLGEQGEVERLLRLEVAVDHRLRDVRRGGDVVEPSARVAVPREEPAGLPEDQRAALRPWDSLSHRHGYRRVTYVLTFTP